MDLEYKPTNGERIKMCLEAVYIEHPTDGDSEIVYTVYEVDGARREEDYYPTFSSAIAGLSNRLSSLLDYKFNIVEQGKRIVINCCYGGFGLSREAFLRLREMGNTYAISEPDYGEYWTDGSGPRKQFAASSFLRDIPRDDPQLVQIVEEMGEQANAKTSFLAVVSVWGNGWYIDEYDGWENIKYR